MLLYSYIFINAASRLFKPMIPCKVILEKDWEAFPDPFPSLAMPTLDVDKDKKENTNQSL